MNVAVAIIKDEHRSIAAVLNGMLYLVGEIRGGHMEPDFLLMRAMLRYIEEFPDKLHQPKEDDYLYRAMRRRSAEAAALLDELEKEHVVGRGLTDGLIMALAAYEASGSAGFEAFEKAVNAYAEFHWSHMRKEEELALPMAEKTLTAADWEEIGKAFQSNQDPVVGVPVTREFRELFKKIVNLAPPPIGVGPAPQ